MQKWLKSIGNFFPEILVFFSLNLFVQLLFLGQQSSLLNGKVVFFSFIELIGLYTTYWLAFSLFSLCFQKIEKILQRIAFLILMLQLFGSITCDQYFLYAHERLDEGVLLFDWNELWIITDIQHRLNLGIILLLISCLIFPYLAIKWIRKKIAVQPHSILLWVSPVLLFASILYFSMNFGFLAQNRFTYFVGRISQALVKDDHSLFRKRVTPGDFKAIPSAFYNGGKQENVVFPCMHKMNESSQLAPFLNQTKNGQVPHITMIVVESMSSDLFGSRSANTGKLMPFMDSLSKNSLYFPNAFSTYQRTHNVLPAVLASVPNTVDGNVFQQIPIPRHYALFNLLKKSYDFRFHCGVPYEYLNMNGFMQHYHAVRLLDKWGKKQKDHQLFVGSNWGYPDEDLFEHAQNCMAQDAHKSKSQLNLFLTISSHDPFVYPNKEKWKQFVLNQSKQIKDEKLRYLISQQAADFGAFSYVDSCLKAFFKRESKTARYQNTIYVITGDHGTELYRRNLLSKYNVPLLIYSPLLKKAFQSNAVVSHNDIAPSILNYLKTKYQLNLPDEVPFVGQELIVNSHFLARRQLLFTINKLRTSELMDKQIVYLQKHLYQFDSTLNLYPIRHGQLKKKYEDYLKAFQFLSHYTILQNHLVDSLSYGKWVGENTFIHPIAEIKHHTLHCEKRMNYIGEKKCYFTKGILRIQCSAQVQLCSKKELEKLPSMVIQTKKTRFFSKHWTINQKIRPQILNYDQKTKKAIIRYALDFDPRKVRQQQHGGIFYVYLFNDTKFQHSFQKSQLSFLRLIQE